MKRSPFSNKRRKPMKRTGFKKRAKTRLKRKIRGNKPKIKQYTTKHADKDFSLYIRQRDGKCLRCGKLTNLTCSHFWGRTKSSTRFDPENCITLCWLPCHYQWEHEKQGEYRDFMIQWLGQEKYDALEKRARSFMQRSEAIKKWQELKVQNFSHP